MRGGCHGNGLESWCSLTGVTTNGLKIGDRAIVATLGDFCDPSHLSVFERQNQKEALWMFSKKEKGENAHILALCEHPKPMGRATFSTELSSSILSAPAVTKSTYHPELPRALNQC